MKKYNYEIGKRYGSQVLVDLFLDNGHIKAKTRCVYCDKITIRRPSSLFQNKHTSCRCRLETLGGLSNSRIYGIYYNMLDRCNNPNCMSYSGYGGKGVRVCDEWSGRDGFKNFFMWACEHGYEEDLTIDRIDSQGNYCPENCQWITRSENTTRANATQHRKANHGDYYGISPDGLFYKFCNANQFSREHPELRAQNIRKCANGGAKSHRGWKFGFVTQLSSREPQSTIESIADCEKQVEYIASEILALEAPSTER